MALSSITELALLDALGIVDGSQFIVGGNRSEPETIRPTGSNPTLRDTGAPTGLAGFFSGFIADTTEDIQAKTVLLVVAGVIAIIGIFAIARKAF